MTADDPRSMRELLHDAVDDVEPRDRLTAVRSRAVGRRRTRRVAWGGGALLAAAATVVAVVLVPGADAPRALDPAAPGPSEASSRATTDPTDSTDPTGQREGETVLRALYFVGDTPRGDRLFREFQQVPVGTGPDDLSTVVAALAAGPDDGDYRTRVPGDGVSAQVVEGEVRVLVPDGLYDDPLAAQQLLRTLEAATDGLPSTWYAADGRVGSVADDRDLLASVSISDPAEGLSVSDVLRARGRGYVFEGTVAWHLYDVDGGSVRDGVTTTADSSRFSPWQVEVDLTGLSAGRYLFVVQEDDVTGDGATSDTRWITVEPDPTD